MPSFCAVCGSEMSKDDDECMFGHEVLPIRKIEKGMASSQDCQTNASLNILRMTAFQTNSPDDKQAYFEALNLAFQRGDLIAYELVAETTF